MNCFISARINLWMISIKSDFAQAYQAWCRVAIEFFDPISTLNLFFLKNEATYSIAQIFKSGCNLIAMKKLASSKIR